VGREHRSVQSPALPAPAPGEALRGLSHLAEMQAIEDEWRRILQPASLVEETYCSQLAHATWHLRCLNQVERDVIAESVRRRAFNGQSAVQLMEWRRAAEATIQTALDKIETCRRLQNEQAQPPRPATPGLAALAYSLAAGQGVGAAAR